MKLTSETSLRIHGRRRRGDESTAASEDGGSEDGDSKREPWTGMGLERREGTRGRRLRKPSLEEGIGE